MRKLILPFLLVFQFLLVYGQDEKKVDEVYGFKNIRFETSIDGMDGMEVVKDAGDIQYYRKKAGMETYGLARLHEVLFGFKKGQLAVIVIECLGKQDSESILVKLSEDYGEGHQKNSFIKKYTWFGKKAGMVFEYHDISQVTMLYIYSKDLYEPL